MLVVPTLTYQRPKALPDPRRHSILSAGSAPAASAGSSVVPDRCSHPPRSGCVRIDLVRRVRAEIRADRYLTEAKLDLAVSRMIEAV
jgi:hypothetical protein